MENINNKKPKLNPEQTIHNWLKVVYYIFNVLFPIQRMAHY